MQTNYLGRHVSPVPAEVLNDLSRYGIQLPDDRDGSESLTSDDWGFSTSSSLMSVLDGED